MKMIFRSDDIGYSDVCNIGAFATMERGVTTSADVMMDTPGTIDALQRLRAFPWISVGWHTHFWGSPVLDPACVPSLVIKENGRIRFRKDLREAADVDLEEAILECRAQIARCVSILGKAPDTALVMGNSNMDQAVRLVCEEYGIARNFAKTLTSFPGAGKMPDVDPRWAGCRITSVDSLSAYEALFTDSITELERYDPLAYYLEDRGHLLEFPEDDVIVQAWHPGYLDYFVYRLGDYGKFARNFILARLADVEMLTADPLKAWIKTNKIELVNYRDALYGTHEYQNHLKAIGSDLAVR
jgi:chitin disaccharide deacetylase